MSAGSFNSTGVLQGLEAMAMHALILQRADHTFDHTVLLRRMRRDELLTQSIAAHERRVVATGEGQAVGRAKQERRWHAPQGAEACDQRLLERRLGGSRLTAAGEMPFQQLPSEAVDDESENRPAIAAARLDES